MLLKPALIAATIAIVSTGSAFAGTMIPYLPNLHFVETSETSTKDATTLPVLITPKK